ncbi:hypothetical protein HELRODRAFT_70735, partial [Helobdella robusta]|uniref:Tyrosine-protein phosphatase domain-containing protein n=1 Tax=Helobdella robusta TaxID=6412 RepID=T1G0B4_HELRO
SDYGGGDMRKAYIATQGCLRNTIGDFWRMVWCHNCMIVVLMTKLSEKTKSGVCSVNYLSTNQLRDHQLTN